MADVTPNPKKRDYLLPPGCKDLIDVLQPRGHGKQHFLGTESQIRLLQSGEDKGGLADIEKYVAMVFASEARTFTLVVIPPGKKLTVDVTRGMGGAMISAYSFIQMNTDEERAARDFFTRHNRPIPEVSDMPAQFFPDLPVHIRFTISPVPPEATLLASFLASFFREVCGLSDQSELCFHYDEFADVA